MRAHDVVIVGGGVIGLSAAYRLRREGLTVVVLERGRCGQEASWAGAGIIQCDGWRGGAPLAQLQRESIQQYPVFADDLRERTGIDPEYEQCGSFELLTEDGACREAAEEVRAAEVHRPECGQPVLELLEPGQVRQREPQLTSELLGVKHCAMTGQVRSPRLLQALRSACLQEGVEIVEGCEVQGLMRQGERIAGVRSSSGDYQAGRVVLAAGAWSSLIEPELGRLMPVHPVRGQIVLLKTSGRLFSRVIEHGKCYLVPRRDNQIIVGATEEHRAGYDKRTTVTGVNGLLTLARRLVPALAEAEVVQCWSGLRPGTPDSLPYLGPVPGCEGLLAATGHFRSGLTLAPLTAQIVTDLIVRGEAIQDLEPFAPGRIQRKSEVSGER